MAYVYKIINDLNNKIYIGQTSFSVEERFKQHLRDAKKDEVKNRPLYSAIRKYGPIHFHIQTIEETDNPLEREKYWIEYYQSFKKGYNATIGGDGKPYIDHQLVISEYLKLKNQNQVAKKLKIDPRTVRLILNANNIEKGLHKDIVQKASGKVINQYDLNDNFIRSFASAREAAESLGKITKTSNGASSHITAVCRGKRKTAYGYKWKFASDEIN